MSLFGKILEKLGFDRPAKAEPVPQPLPAPRTVPVAARKAWAGSTRSPGFFSPASVVPASSTSGIPGSASFPRSRNFRHCSCDLAFSPCCSTIFPGIEKPLA